MGGVLLLTVRVDVQNDWLDYVTAMVGLLTAVAALWGLHFARQDAKRANVAVEEANQEIANLRGVLEPTDRLLRTRAQRAMVDRLIDRNPYKMELEINDPMYVTTPTAHMRYVELAQRELVFLPDHVLPRLRQWVDSSEGINGRPVRKVVEGPMPTEAEILDEQEAYRDHLDAALRDLESDPQATGGVYDAI
jgi:hypothetical protein